jgi:hypothetical protein
MGGQDLFPCPWRWRSWATPMPECWPGTSCYVFGASRRASLSSLGDPSTLVRIGTDLIVFPAHALLMLEGRLGKHEADAVAMPEGMQRDELALRILIAHP